MIGHILNGNDYVLDLRGIGSRPDRNPRIDIMLVKNDFYFHHVLNSFTVRLLMDIIIICYPDHYRTFYVYSVDFRVYSVIDKLI